MKIRVPLKPPNCCFDVFHCGMGQVSLRLLICSICVHQINSSSSRRGGGRLSRQEQIFRPLVPQMLPNYTAPALPPASEVSCMMAAISCNYRSGCGSALRQYREACATLVEGSTTSCSTACQHALVGLISTEEGERLMACSCQSQDCALEKRRVEPCRDKVTWHTAPGTVVPCSAATAICQASPECEIALHYFNTNCKELFKGGECTEACRNSARILARQRAAEKLTTCTCGDLRSKCASIRENTNSLCFDKDNTVKKKKKQTGEKGHQTQGPPQLIQFVLTILLTFFGASMRGVFKMVVD